MTRTLSLAGAAALALLAAGCTAPAPDARITDLRTRLDQARNDPTIAQYSQAQLSQAGQSLAQAQSDSRKGDGVGLDHSLYMGNRQLDVARANAEAQQARAQRETAAARMQAEGRTVAQAGVLFQPGKATLKAGAEDRLSQLASYLRANPGQTVTVQGFTDSTGSSKANQALSERRAEAVKRALVAQGIDANRIIAEGMGESNPVASNATPSGRQQNRRVEVALAPE